MPPMTTTPLDDARAESDFHAEHGWFRTTAPAALRALIAEHERLTAPPTDDEREALARLLRGDVGIGGMPWETVADAYRKSADRAIAAGFRRQGPITDAYVDAVFQGIRNGVAWRPLGRDEVRAALEAARLA